MPQRLKNVLLFLLLLFSINFFEGNIFKGFGLNAVRFVFLIGAIALSVPYLLPKRRGFVLPVQLIFVSLVLSVFASYGTWQQGLSDYILGTIPYMLIVFFFYLKKTQYPTEPLENMVVIYGTMYVAFYFFQLAHADTVYFGTEDSFDFSRGIARVDVPGRGLFYLMIFIALCRFSTRKSYRWFWMLLIAAGTAVTFLAVTRQFIVALLVILLIHFLKNQSLSRKIIISGFFALAVFYVAESDNPLIKALTEAQENNMQEGAQNVRVQASLYFLTDFSPSFINKILGNGVPHGDYSKYQKFSRILEEDRGFYFSDIGIVAVYSMFGILAVIAYLLIWGKSFLIRVPDELYYVKYYLWLLLFCGFTSDAIYYRGDLIPTIFVLYIYQTIYEKQKLALTVVNVEHPRPAFPVAEN